MLFQGQFTERRPLLAFTLNGTLSQPQNTRYTLSAPLLFAVIRSSLSLLSCSLDELRDLLLPRRLFLAQRCVELQHTVLVMFLTGNETDPNSQPQQSPKRKSS